MLPDLLISFLGQVQSTNPAEVVSDLAGRFHIEIPRLIASAINFGLVAIALYYLAFRPVLRTMDERNRKIEDGLKYADEMKERLAETEAMHEEKLRSASLEAKRIVSEAREQAKAQAERQAAQARNQAEDLLKKAQESIEAERRSMLEEVRGEVARLVVATSSKVLERELSEEERRSYSERAARQMAGNN